MNIGEHYQAFEDIFRLRRGSPIRNQINLIVLQLELFYGINRIEIREMLFDHYIYNNIYNKYNMDKCNIKTFVFKYILLQLKNLRNNRSKHKYNKEAGRMIEKDYRKGDLMDIGQRVEDYDFDNIDHSDTDIVEIQEIYEIAAKKFGEIDAKVILGEISVKKGAKLQNRKYTNYADYIKLAKSEFKTFLLDQGYANGELEFMDQ